MNLFFQSFVICLTFVAVQIVASYAFVCWGEVMGCDTILCQVLTSLSSSIICIAIITMMGMVNWKSMQVHYAGSVFRALGLVLFSFLFIVGLNLLSEWIDLPDYNAQRMLDFAHHPLGMLALVLVSPITEELVFREALVGGMVRRGAHVLPAVLLSSLFFGLAHFNPIQIPFAFVMGLFFSYLYVKTRGIFLPIVLHVLNNGCAVLLLLLFGTDVTLVDFFCNPVQIIVVSVVMCVVGGCAVRYLLNKQ